MKNLFALALMIVGVGVFLTAHTMPGLQPGLSMLGGVFFGWGIVFLLTN